MPTDKLYQYSIYLVYLSVDFGLCFFINKHKDVLSNVFTCLLLHNPLRVWLLPVLKHWRMLKHNIGIITAYKYRKMIGQLSCNVADNVIQYTPLHKPNQNPKCQTYKIECDKDSSRWKTRDKKCFRVDISQNDTLTQ